MLIRPELKRVHVLIVLLSQDVADLDHSEFDCLMVAILTHGINGKLYSTNSELIDVEQVKK